MKVLVVTREIQGARKSDFCWANEGEIAAFGSVCRTGSSEDVDGCCGCQRSMIGVESRKGTTTVKVVSKRKFVVEDLANALIKGYCDAYGKDANSPEAIEYGLKQAIELVNLAKRFKVGDVVEIRGDKIQTRKFPIDFS